MKTMKTKLTKKQEKELTKLMLMHGNEQINNVQLLNSIRELGIPEDRIINDDVYGPRVMDNLTYNSYLLSKIHRNWDEKLAKELSELIRTTKASERFSKIYEKYGLSTMNQIYECSNTKCVADYWHNSKTGYVQITYSRSGGKFGKYAYCVVLPVPKNK